jgi:valyl-tRNA synthetase (EC 6.1.1.9)
MWNALKLVKIWEGKQNEKAPEGSAAFAVQWFENRLAEASLEVEKLFKDFKLSEALKTLYSLIWDDFCSWYLEWVKPAPDQPINAGVYQKTVMFFVKTDAVAPSLHAVHHRRNIPRAARAAG